jgi:hypothetical protein
MGGALLFIAAGMLAPAAGAQSPPARGGAVPLFSIAKSENRNQVQYVVQVDAQCVPFGPAPVSAYWRMLESGPTQTAPILPRELRAYGLVSQKIAATASGSQVRAILRALPDRPLMIATSRGVDGVCHALATGTVAGSPVHLFNVYVHLVWDGVDYLLLQGWSMDGSHIVHETMKK